MTPNCANLPTSSVSNLKSGLDLLDTAYSGKFFKVSVALSTHRMRPANLKIALGFIVAMGLIVGTKLTGDC